jgi:hypothetical protein
MSFYLLPYVILKVILYSMFCFISQHTSRIYVNEISYLKAVSIVYWNVLELQPEDGLKKESRNM